MRLLHKVISSMVPPLQLALLASRITVVYVLMLYLGGHRTTGSLDHPKEPAINTST